jgi:hypothetical protein
MVSKMNRGRIFLMIIIVACATIVFTPVASAEEFTPLLSVTVSDNYLTAGQENKIEIALKNTGDFNVYEVQTFLSVSATTPGISILEGAHSVVNKISDGQVKRLYPVLYVDRSTPLGTYTLTFQVNYIKVYKLGSLQQASSVVQVGVVVHNVTKPRIDLDVSISAPKLRAGAEEVVDVSVENIGEEPLYGLDVRVSSSSPYIVLLEGGRYTDESLGSKNVTTFNPSIFISRNAPLGVYTLSAAVTYEDMDGKEYYEAFTLGVNVDTVKVAEQTSVVLQGYSTNPETVMPGDVFNLKLALACSRATAYEVKTSLALTPGSGISLMSPSLIDVGDMEAEATAEVVYRLIVNGGLLAGQYPATLTLSYLDVDGVPRNLVESVTISVRGIVEFSLINDDPVTVGAGDQEKLEADLLLIGTESVQFLDIEVVEDSIFRRVSGSEEYIGAVDPDSPIPFDLNFGVADDAEQGDHPLRLKLTYTDDLNQENEDVLEAPVTVIETSIEPGTSGGSNGGFWAWLRRLFGLGP